MRAINEYLTWNEHLAWRNLARAVAAEYQLVLTDEAADHILWEHTGYPGFWKGEPAEECIRQLREHCAETVQWVQTDAR